MKSRKRKSILSAIGWLICTIMKTWKQFLWNFQREKRLLYILNLQCFTQPLDGSVSCLETSGGKQNESIGLIGKKNGSPLTCLKKRIWPFVGQIWNVGLTSRQFMEAKVLQKFVKIYPMSQSMILWFVFLKAFKCFLYACKLHSHWLVILAFVLKITLWVTFAWFGVWYQSPKHSDYSWGPGCSHEHVTWVHDIIKSLLCSIL